MKLSAKKRSNGKNKKVFSLPEIKLMIREIERLRKIVNSAQWGIRKRKTLGFNYRTLKGGNANG